jgi:hypothetical protein
MKPTIISPKMQRQRKMLLLMPLLVVPLLTLLFWAFGGGKRSAAKAEPSGSGLDTRLPDAKPKEMGKLDKMSYYDLAAKDSARLGRAQTSDPYYKSRPAIDSPGHFSGALSGVEPLHVTNAPTLTEAIVRSKLAELEAANDRPQAARPVKKGKNEALLSPPGAPAPPVQQDAELSQMNGLLEKILEIQHPERLGRQASPPAVVIGPFRGVPALVDGTQRITQGTVIRLKLADTATIAGILFEKGQLIYGRGTLSNQRYLLSVKSIRVGNTFYPVNLTVFDQTDGLEGISVPEAVTGEAIGEGAVSGVQGMELMSLDPSLSAQLAGAGINAAKGLFSKKVRRLKGKIKSGHPLLLRVGS